MIDLNIKVLIPYLKKNCQLRKLNFAKCVYTCENQVEILKQILFLSKLSKWYYWGCSGA